MQDGRYFIQNQDTKFPLIFSFLFHCVLFLFLGVFFNNQEIEISQITVDLSQEIEIPKLTTPTQKNNDIERNRKISKNLTKEIDTFQKPKEQTKKPSSLREEMQNRFGKSGKKIIDNQLGNSRGVKRPSVNEFATPKITDKNFTDDNSRDQNFIKKVGTKEGGGKRTQRRVPSNNDNKVNESYGQNNNFSKTPKKRTPSKKGAKLGKVSRNNNVQFKFKDNKRRFLIAEKKIFIPSRIKKSGIATKVVFSFAIKSNGFVYDIQLKKSSGIPDLDLIVRRYIQNLKFNRLQGDVSSYRTMLTYDFSVKKK